MAIHTQSRPNLPNFVNLSIVAAAVAAIAIGAMSVGQSAGSKSTPPAWDVAPSFMTTSAAPTAGERFRAEMRMHEALTEAQFGRLASSDADLAITRAIAEHEALLAPLLDAQGPGQVVLDEVAQAIAQHEAMLEPVLIGEGVEPRQSTGVSAEVSAAIAQHDALIEPFVS